METIEENKSLKELNCKSSSLNLMNETFARLEKEYQTTVFPKIKPHAKLVPHPKIEPHFGG